MWAPAVRPLAVQDDVGIERYASCRTFEATGSHSPSGLTICHWTMAALVEHDIVDRIIKMIGHRGARTLGVLLIDHLHQQDVT